MSREIVVEHRFTAVVDVVWEKVSDHCGMRRWLVPGMSVRLQREGEPAPNGKGAVRVIEGAGVRAVEEVVEFEPPNRMVYVVLSGFPIKEHRGEIRLEPEGGTTRLVWTVRFDPRYPGTGGILRWIVRGVFSRGLRRLEELIAAEET